MKEFYQVNVTKISEEDDFEKGIAGRGTMPSVLESKLPIFAKEESDLMNCVDQSNEHLFALMRGLTHDKQPAEIKRVENHVADCAVSIARQIGENLKIKLATIRTAREFR